MFLRYCLLALLVAMVLANKKTKPTRAPTTARNPATTPRRTTALPDPGQNGDASAFCQSRSQTNRRNQKNYYADANNCHNYYHCFFVNETYSIGFLRTCPAGQFWHDAVFSCMPEGDVPCVDACLTGTQRCYAGSGCRQFFSCSNTGSYGMCCPSGTSFNAATCSCDDAPTCTDACVQAGPSVPTSVAPATQLNSTVCRDSFGAVISTVAGQANAYTLVDEEGQGTGVQYCPGGIDFDLITCRCNTENEDATTPSSLPNPKATFFMNFNPPNADQDKSINKFAAFFFDGAEITTGLSATGGNGGSLDIPQANARVSVPAFLGFDFRAAGSWCAHFRCDSQPNNQCSFNGGILSNNLDSASSLYTFIFGVQSSNTFNAKLSFSNGNSVTLSSSFSVPSNGWNGFCVTYDGATARLYLNGGERDSENVAGILNIGQSPMIIGTDQASGTFLGHIDTVFVSTFAIDADTANGHFNSGTSAVSQYL